MVWSYLALIMMATTAAFTGKLCVLREKYKRDGRLATASYRKARFQ